MQVTNDALADERIDNIAKHCEKYGFDNVMLCINQEEFNVGHITLEMAKPWVEVLKKAAKVLRSHGLSVSVNNWIEIGHADRGRDWFDGQDFQPFVDINGKAARNIACPLCEKWFDYYAEYAGYLVREIKPDTYWIEDDFRLHNHAPLQGIGCYCEKHMAYYNEKLGTNYTREEFIKKVFAKGPLTPERKVWLDANRDVMLSLAEKLAKAIKKANPETDLALMTSRPAPHCIEARDWDRLLSNLAQGGNKINRIHLPYGETNGKEFLTNINSMSMAIRALSPKDSVIMPEIEHGSATFYSKTPRYLRFTLEASIPLILSGSTYSIYGFHANGARDSFGFGEVVKSLQPYMQAVRDLDIDFASQLGVVVPIDEKACYYKEINSDYLDLTATEFIAAAYLSGLGINYTYSKQKKFENKTVFMTGSNVDYFTDGELCDLFSNNFVICDADFASKLQNRGLLSLIHAKSVKPLSYDNGEYSYEECFDENTVICGVRKMRASARARCLPPCKNIEYEDGADVLTTLCDHYMTEVAAGMVRGDNFLVLPFSADKIEYAMFDDLRRHFIISAIAETKNYVITDSVGISPYLYENVLMLTNGNVDTYESIKIRTDLDFSKIKKLGKDGKFSDCAFTKSEDKIIIDDTLEYLSCNVYVIEK